MNNTMTYNPTDLVLRFSGGPRDGETIAVSTPKCVLGIPAGKSDPTQSQLPYQCAIFRGPNGVAVKSDNAGVLVNGNAKSVHWLQQGDMIQLPNSTGVEVFQLGIEPAPEPAFQANETTARDEADRQDTVEPTAGDWPADEPALAEEPAFADDAVTEAPVTEPQLDAAEDHVDYYSESIVVEEPAVSTTADYVSPAETATENTAVQNRLQSLESSIEGIHSQTTQTNERFERLESRLCDLTDYLEQLINDRIAEAGQVADRSESAVAETAQAVETCVEPNAVEEVVAAIEPVVTEPVAVEPAVIESSVEQVAVEPLADEPVIDLIQEDAPVEQTPPTVDSDSIASLFSQLAATTEETTLENTHSQDGYDETALEAPVLENTQVETTESADSDVMNELASAFATVSDSSADAVAATTDANAALENAFAVETPESPVVDIDDATAEAVDANDEAESADDQSFAAGSLAEQLFNSIRAEDEAEAEATQTEETQDTTSAEVSHDIASTEELPAVTPDRRATRTESVTEIFSRLHASNKVERQADATLSAADLQPQLRESVDTSYEEVEAELSAAMRQTAPQTPADFQAPVEPEATEDPVAPTADSIADVLSRITKEQEQAASSDTGAANGLITGEMATTETVAEAEEVTTEAPQSVQPQPTAGNGDDSVEDYMSQLLSRMRGGATEVEAPATAVVEEVKPVEEPAPVVDTRLTDEEFRPKQVAVPIKSFSAMRELANSTSRSAIQRSKDVQRKERTQSLMLQSLTGMSLILAIVAYLAGRFAICGAFSGIFLIAFVFYCVAVLGIVPTTVTKKKRTEIPTAEDNSDVPPLAAEGTDSDV